MDDEEHGRRDQRAHNRVRWPTLEFPFDPAEINLKVGLEIHQQLASRTKLFCRCPIKKSEELPLRFERRLRPTQSELGHIDPTAIFEYSKGRANVYQWNTESSCLVEADDEPPRPLNEDALDTAVIIAELLHANVVDEIHVMRKIVIDGSNTSGFQRTSVVGLEGKLVANETEVGVQSVTLEEDSARILREDSEARYFALDRLGIPLVEVALEPLTGLPEWIEGVALHLGRTLRSTGRVARGLGTIRQDLNVSVRGGSIVEVKGVQKLNLLAKVLHYEVTRQMGLAKIAETLKKRRVRVLKTRQADVTALSARIESKVLQREVKSGGKVLCISAAGFAGLFGYEPFPGIRLGKELAEVARASGLGGIIHSDEFQKQGLSKGDAEKLIRAVKGGLKPGLILVAGIPHRVDAAAENIVHRLRLAISGVPAETRAATEDGETRYMRPRPGAARMYPETDIPEIVVTQHRRTELSGMLPPSWQEKVKEYERVYLLSPDLALRVYDSDNSQLFDELSKTLKLDASLIASVLVELPVRLTREGIPEERLSSEILAEVLRAVEKGKVAKEALPEVLRILGKGDARDVGSTIDKLGLQPLASDELNKIIEKVLAENRHLVAQKGENAFSPLMGEIMRIVRGRVDGSVVSKVLRDHLEKVSHIPSKSSRR